VSALHSAAAAAARPALSIVIPVCNEADNVVPLAREIKLALAALESFEIIFVDDGSSDATAANVLQAKRDGIAEIRLIRHARRSGQSIALLTGVRVARASWVATLDGDGQNDPADIPHLLAMRDRAGAEQVKLLIGHRRSRKDSWVRRASSRVANSVRRAMLNDGTPDTGCGIKLFERAVFLELPVFNHMHRFLPALFLRAGSEVTSVPVHHRPRTRGKSKYGVGDRLWVGIIDLFGVRWLVKRAPAIIARTEEG
jgi:dolichol-phosphate mannosyltransferase